jgi:RND family efflux transporter MFP subunit
VSGVVTAIEAEVGQVVSAGAPVVRIAQDGPRDVVFSVPEDKVAAIRPGSDVSVRVWADGTALAGKVREIAASADPVTRTYAIKVALDAAAKPALGATVYVSPQALSHAGTPVIKLPTSALRKEGQGTAVWVLDKSTMTLASQAVQVVTADGNQAVISAGLEPGMLVVSAGVHVLSPGQKVAIYQEKTAQSTAAAVQDAARNSAAASGTAQAATLPAAR